jgi:hypothetical protein
MQDRKRNPGSTGRRNATIDRDPDPGLETPGEEIRLPAHDPTKGRTIEEPGPRRRKRVDDTVETPAEDDDVSGEMDAAGQDLGLLAEDEREATNLEDGTEDEEADWIDHDDDTDRGRGQFD